MNSTPEWDEPQETKKPFSTAEIGHLVGGKTPRRRWSPRIRIPYYAKERIGFWCFVTSCVAFGNVIGEFAWNWIH